MLLSKGKQRYTTNNAHHMKRHINRAEVKRDESLRVTCKVIENGITCTKRFRTVMGSEGIYAVVIE